MHEQRFKPLRFQLLHQVPTGGDPPGSSPQFTRGYVADGAEELTRFSTHNA